MERRVYLNSNDLDNICNKIIWHLGDIDYISGLLCRLMYYTGCRVGEAVGIDRYFIRIGNELWINPQKENNQRKIKTNNNDVLYIYEQLSTGDEYNIMSISKLERDIRAVNPLGNCYVKNKPVVCNLFRHNFVKKYAGKGKTNAEIQGIMGHKEITNTLHYIKSEIYVKKDISSPTLHSIENLN